MYFAILAINGIEIIECVTRMRNDIKKFSTYFFAYVVIMLEEKFYAYQLRVISLAHSK